VVKYADIGIIHAKNNSKINKWVKKSFIK
jgi:hypothetical protein